MYFGKSVVPEGPPEQKVQISQIKKKEKEKPREAALTLTKAKVPT
jgi:hypothetical protein